MPIRIRKRPGYVRWTAAGSFQAVSLMQYFLNEINNGTVLPGGYGGGPWSIPTPGSISGGIVIIDKTTAIVHEATLGIIYTTTLDQDEPVWRIWNTGLTTDQTQAADRIMICHNGSIYILSEAAGANAFLAYASMIGGAFTVFEDNASLQAKYGVAHDAKVIAIGQDFSSPELVAYATLMDGSNVKFFLGSGGVFSEIGTISSDSFNGADLTFGEGSWVFTNGNAFILNAGLTAVTGFTVISTGQPTTRHLRIPNTGTTYHWDDADGLSRGDHNMASIENHIGSGLNPGGVSHLKIDKVVASATGTTFMTLANDYSPVKSPDGGYTWIPITTLPFTTSEWYFDNMPGDDNFWIAVGDSIQVSEDGGDTWIDKNGNLADLIATTPSFNAVKML